MARGNNALTKIGTVKVSGQVIDVLYVGGSAFTLGFDKAADQQKSIMMKDRVDELIAARKIRLTSEDEYARICEQIDPVTGETKTHHADGTEKSEVDKALGEINESRAKRFKGPEEHVTMPSGDDPFGSSAGVEDPSTAHSMTRSKPEASAPDPFVDPFGEGSFPVSNGRSSGTTIQGTDDPFTESDDSMSSDPTTQHSMSRSKAARDLPKDFDADDESSDSDAPISLKKSPTARGTGLVILASVSVVACAVLFFGSFALMRGLRANGRNIPVIGEFLSGGSTDDRSDLPANERVRAGDTSATTTAASGLEIVVRSDFDPESAVIGYALADDQSKEVAKQFFSAVRLAYKNGDTQSLNSMIAYGTIHNQIAQAYALAEQQRLVTMTDAERDALQVQYGEILTQQEGLHASQGDMDASIYCGRIREVRVDDTDAKKLYVVMESLAGDHQRICFVLQGDHESNAYALIGVMNPEGYVQMVRAGEVE